MNQNDTITFTMRLDASDLKTLGLGAPGRGAGGRAAGGGGGGGGGGGWFANFFGGGGSSSNSTQQAKTNAKALGHDPSFKSIFKPLATLSIMNKAIGGILSQSKIANTYGSAFGKIIGAMLDLLLVPFLPVFNMIMVALTKLMTWLIESGVLDEIAKIVDRAEGYLESIAHWIVQVWQAITHLDFGKAAELIIKGILGGIGQAIKDPMGAAMTGGLALLGGSIVMGLANKLTFGLAGKAAGGVLKLGGKAALGGVKGLGRLFGLGGGAGEAAAGEAAAGGAADVAGAGGAAAGAGGIGLGGLLGPGLLAAGGGLAAGAGANYLLGKAGVHGTARQALTGAAGGAAAGAIIGSIVPGVGTLVGAGAGGLIGGGIGLMKGLMGGGGGNSNTAGQNGVNIQNSNNTIYLTQNNTINQGGSNPKQIADMAIKEIEQRTGFKLAVRGGH